MPTSAVAGQQAARRLPRAVAAASESGSPAAENAAPGAPDAEPEGSGAALLEEAPARQPAGPAVELHAVTGGLPPSPAASPTVYFLRRAAAQQPHGIFPQ